MGIIKKMALLPRLLLAAASILLLLIVLPETTKAAEADRFGYSKLSSDKEKEVYTLLVDAIKKGEDELALTGMDIMEAQLRNATEMVVLDYPEFFWFAGYKSYTATHKGAPIQTVTLWYSLNGKDFSASSSELKAAQTALDREISEILAGMPKGGSYEKALYLHDYLVEHVAYQNATNDQQAYGALVEHKAVCAGYTHAYQLLLRKAGIDSLYITGEGISSSGIEAHAWLLVWLDGECYYTDVTWDDPVTDDGKQVTGHYYFNMSLDDISKDHVPEAKYNGWLPEHHSHKQLSYFEKEKGEDKGIGWFDNSTPPKSLFNYLVKNGRTYTCDIRFDGDDFNGWLESACRDVASKLGRVSVSYQPVGHEYLLTITTQHETSKIEAKSATCMEEGNKAYYVCDVCGRFFEDAEGNQEITDKSAVVISKTSHTAGAWKSNDSKHWKECTQSGCNAVISETSGSHADNSGDKCCDVCGYQMSDPTATTPSTPVTEATTPPTETTPPPTEATTPPTETTPPPTEATTPPSQSTVPATDATEETTPVTDATEETILATDATQDVTTPTQGTQNPPSENDGTEIDTTTIMIVGAGAACVVIAVVAFVVLRKKRGI